MCTWDSGFSIYSKILATAHGFLIQFFLHKDSNQPPSRVYIAMYIHTYIVHIYSLFFFFSLKGLWLALYSLTDFWVYNSPNSLPWFALDMYNYFFKAFSRKMLFFSEGFDLMQINLHVSQWPKIFCLKKLQKKKSYKEPSFCRDIFQDGFVLNEITAGGQFCLLESYCGFLGSLSDALASWNH